MRKLIILITAVLMLSWGGAAFADNRPGNMQNAREEAAEEFSRPTPGKDELLEYMETVSQQYGVPLGLMVAISSVESRFNPWALNIAGKSYFPDSKKAALEKLEESAGIESFDVGIMQINSLWLRRFKISASDAMEPHVNILLGAYILNENFIAYGPGIKAVAAYHSPNRDRGSRYAKEVWRYYQAYIRGNK